MTTKIEKSIGLLQKAGRTKRNFFKPTAKMRALDINGLYDCKRCRHAEDIHGRGCGIDPMFPVLLAMGGKLECPNHEFDEGKALELDGMKQRIK